MYERRAESRVRADFDVQVETLSGTCLDLSACGMRLQTEWSIPVGLRVQLTLSGLGRGNEQVTGRVTHWYEREGEVGVRFVRVSQGAHRDIRQYLREHRPTRRDETSLSRLCLHHIADAPPADRPSPSSVSWDRS